jgi:hypothetical protein
MDIPESGDSKEAKELTYSLCDLALVIAAMRVDNTHARRGLQTSRKDLGENAFYSYMTGLYMLVVNNGYHGYARSMQSIHRIKATERVCWVREGVEMLTCLNSQPHELSDTSSATRPVLQSRLINETSSYRAAAHASMLGCHDVFTSYTELRLEGLYE